MAITTDIATLGIVALLWAAGYFFLRVGEGKNIFKKELFWTYLIWAMLNFAIVATAALEGGLTAMFGTNPILFMVGAAIWTSASLMLWKSLEKAEVNTIAIMTAIYPLVTAVLAYTLLGQEFTIGAMFAVGLAIIIGILLVVL